MAAGASWEQPGPATPRPRARKLDRSWAEPGPSSRKLGDRRWEEPGPSGRKATGGGKSWGEPGPSSRKSAGGDRSWERPGTSSGTSIGLKPGTSGQKMSAEKPSSGTSSICSDTPELATEPTSGDGITSGNIGSTNGRTSDTGIVGEVMTTGCTCGHVSETGPTSGDGQTKEETGVVTTEPTSERDMECTCGHTHDTGTGEGVATEVVVTTKPTSGGDFTGLTWDGEEVTGHRDGATTEDVYGIVTTEPTSGESVTTECIRGVVTTKDTSGGDIATGTTVDELSDTIQTGVKELSEGKVELKDSEVSVEQSDSVIIKQPRFSNHNVALKNEKNRVKCTDATERLNTEVDRSVSELIYSKITDSVDQDNASRNDYQKDKTRKDFKDLDLTNIKSDKKILPHKTDINKGHMYRRRVGREEHFPVENLTGRTYENGDSNNNVVEDDDDEKLRSNAESNERNIPSPDTDVSTFSNKIETVTLVGGNAPSSGVEGSSERSDSDESRDYPVSILKFRGIARPTPANKRYVSLSKRSGTSDSISEKDSELLSAEKERFEKPPPLPPRNSSEKSKVVRKKRVSMILPGRVVCSSDSTSEDDFLPTTEESKRRLNFRSRVKKSSDATISEGSMPVVEESFTSERGIATPETSEESDSVVIVEKVGIVKETENFEKKYLSDVTEEDSSVREIVPVPLRQASYKIAVKNVDFPKDETTQEPLTTQDTDEPEKVVEKQIDSEETVPKKKPLLRKTSYELAVKNEIDMKPPVTPIPILQKLPSPGILLSVGSLLRANESERNKILKKPVTENVAAHTEDAFKLPKSNNLTREDNTFLPKDVIKLEEKEPDTKEQTEIPINETKLEDKLESSELSCTESATISTSTASELNRLTNFEKILPLGGILTLIKGRPPSESSWSQSDSIYSLPWDTQGPNSNKAQSIDNLTSLVAQTSRRSSSSNSIEELLYIIKDSAPSNTIATWIANVEDVLGISRSSSVSSGIPSTSDTKEGSAEKTPSFPSTPKVSAELVKKDNLELKKIIDIIENMLSCYKSDDAEVNTATPQTKSESKTDSDAKKSKHDETEGKTAETDIEDNDSTSDESSSDEEKYIYPYDQMMRIMLSNEVPEVNGYILNRKRESVTKPLSLFARKFKINGEIVLVEDDLPMCKDCRTTSIYSLWAKQVIARLDDRHIYANIPPYAENLTVIRRILGKITKSLVENNERAKRVQYFASRKFKKRIFKRRKGSRKNVKKFVKGAIEVIPELEEVTDQESVRYEDKDDDDWVTDDEKDEATTSDNDSEDKNENGKKWDSDWQSDAKLKMSDKKESEPQSEDEDTPEGTSMPSSPEIKKSPKKPWWKKWKRSKRPKKTKQEPQIKFPDVPLSMNLIYHDNGRLEVMYGLEGEFPYTVAKYSSEEGRFLTLEEYYLKKHCCYQPPQDYFFNINGHTTNLTIIQLSKPSYFFRPKGKNKQFPSVYSFEPSDYPGVCPNKRHVTAKHFLYQWFTRSKAPPVKDKGFIEEEIEIQLLKALPYTPLNQSTPVNEMNSPDEPPPKVGPKPVKKEKVVEKPNSNDDDNTNELIKDLPPGIHLLPQGTYYYPYKIDENINDFLKLIFHEKGPPCVAVLNAKNDRTVQRLVDKYVKPNFGDEDFKRIIFRVYENPFGARAEIFNLGTNPPSQISGNVLNEYLDSESSPSKPSSRKSSSSTNVEDELKSESIINVVEPVEGKIKSQISTQTVPYYEPRVKPPSAEKGTNTDPELQYNFPDIDAASIRLEPLELQVSTKPSSDEVQYGKSTYPWSYPSTSAHSPISATVDIKQRKKMPLPLEEVIRSRHSSTDSEKEHIPIRPWSYPSSVHSPTEKTGFKNLESPHLLRGIIAEINESTDTTGDEVVDQLKDNVTQTDGYKHSRLPSESSFDCSLSEAFEDEKPELELRPSLDESKVPDWYLPRQSRTSLQRVLAESEKRSGQYKMPDLPLYVNLPALKESHQVIQSYRYPWEDPGFTRSMVSKLLTQDKVAVQRRKSTGGIPYYENVSFIEATQTSLGYLRPRQLEDTFETDVEDRLMQMSDIHQRGRGQTPEDMRQLSPSYYSLCQYPLTEAGRPSGIYPSPSRHSIGAYSDKVKHIEWSPTTAATWCRPRMYTSGARHSIGRSLVRSQALAETTQPGYPCCPAKRSIGTSPLTSEHYTRWSTGTSRLELYPTTSRFSIETSSSSVPMTDGQQRPKSRHSIGTVSEKIQVFRKRRQLAKSRVKYGGRFTSRSSEYIGERIVRHYLIDPIKEQQSTKGKDKKGVSAKFISRSSENIAERIAYHYLLEDTDTETTSKEQGKPKKKRRPKKRYSRSSENIAQRMAYHYMVHSEHETNTTDASVISSRTTISSPKTTHSCPIHGLRSPGSPLFDLPQNPNPRTRSTPYLSRARESPIRVQDRIEPSDVRDSPIWRKGRNGRTRTV